MDLEKNNLNILIVTGEQSADLHTAKIAKQLSNSLPEYHLWGTGGANLKNQNVELIADINQMACMGIIDSIKKIFFFKLLRKKILNQTSKRNPAIAILVDFSGFNLNLAQKLHQLKIPVLYFITPKIWAWGEKRALKLAKYVTHAAVILPFEEKILANFNIPCSYVGNPTYEQLHTQQKTFKKNSTTLTLGLIPGSREKEVKRHLKILIAASELLSKKININIILSKSPNLNNKLYLDIPSYIQVKHDATEVMKNSDIIIIASGTATLEAAILKTPMIIIYKTDYISAWLFKKFSKTKWVGLPNILLKKNVTPEALQCHANPESLASLTLTEIKNLEKQIIELNKINDLLKTKSDYATNTTQIILSLIKEPNFEEISGL